MISGCIGHVYSSLFSFSCSCSCSCSPCGRLRSIAPTFALVLIASTIALIRIKIRFCCMLLVCFCSGSRVGCGDLCKYRRHACRYSRRFEIADRGLVRPTKAEREREGSAAELVQRMNARRAVLYPGAMPPARCVEARCARTREVEHRHPKI